MSRMSDDLTVLKRRWALKPAAESILPKSRHGNLAQGRLRDALHEILRKGLAP